MKARGERIIIVGDSLSHPGPDAAPTIQEIRQGSSRASSAPGDLLGSLLLEQGAEAVRVNAKVGRSAISLLGSEPASSLFAADHLFKPTKVVVMLGTNDAERDLAKTEASMATIRDAYRKLGAEVWAIGPMAYVGRGAYLNAKAAQVFEAMQRVFGAARTIDARPLSSDAFRAGDGIHFTQDGARAVAPRLAQALLSANALSITKPMITAAIGFASVFMLGLAAWWYRRRQSVSQVSGSRRKRLGPEPQQQAYRGYLIKERADNGFSITRGGHVVQHQTPSIEQAKRIIDELTGDDLAGANVISYKGHLIRERPTGGYTVTRGGRTIAPYAMNASIAKRMVDSGMLRGLGFDVLSTIAKESRSPEEFALRAEAWASSEAKPPSDKKLAIAYERAGHPRSKDTVIRLIRRARAKRETNAKARWRSLIRQPTEQELDGLGARPDYTQIEAEIRRVIDQQVTTSATGKALLACDAKAVGTLTNNVARNLVYTVDGMIEDSLEP